MAATTWVWSETRVTRSVTRFVSPEPECKGLDWLHRTEPEDYSVVDRSISWMSTVIDFVRCKQCSGNGVKRGCEHCVNGFTVRPTLVECTACTGGREHTTYRELTCPLCDGSGRTLPEPPVKLQYDVPPATEIRPLQPRLYPNVPYSGLPADRPWSFQIYIRHRRATTCSRDFRLTSLGIAWGSTRLPLSNRRFGASRALAPASVR